MRTVVQYVLQACMCLQRDDQLPFPRSTSRGARRGSLRPSLVLPRFRPTAKPLLIDELKKFAKELIYLDVQRFLKSVVLTLGSGYPTLRGLAHHDVTCPDPFLLYELVDFFSPLSKKAVALDHQSSHNLSVYPAPSALDS